MRSEIVKGRCKGEFSKEQNIVFLHTGGAAALFAYADQLEVE